MDNQDPIIAPDTLIPAVTVTACIIAGALILALAWLS